MNKRDEFRKRYLARRDGLSEEDRRSKSAMIGGKVLELKEIERARNIFIYVDFRSEVQTRNLIKNLMERGKRISVPITLTRQKKIEAIHIRNLEEDLVPGYCNIPEPREELVANSITDPHNIDVVIIPGSVFDDRGGRMGYGGGYYDRFLEKIPFAVRIGLAYEVQKVQEIPLQPHDELLDYIITEERVDQFDRI